MKHRETVQAFLARHDSAGGTGSGIVVGNALGAGSVVTRDLPPCVFAAGNPCRVIRELNERDKEYYFRNMRADQVEW